MTTIPFAKMVGTGNDFIIVEANRHRLRGLQGRWPAVSRALCDRRRGIGADGVLVLAHARAADVTMRVFNPNGSEAAMCGNGARCVALYVEQARNGHSRRRPVTIQTMAGRLSATVRGDRVAMRMMDPVDVRLNQSILVDGRRTAFSFINTGVPHAVVPVANLDRVDVSRIGRRIRLHRAFAPEGANVNFIQAIAQPPPSIRIRTYERGVEEETPACGTGVVASAILHTLARQLASARLRRSARNHRVAVTTRSGDRLTVSFVLDTAHRAPRVTEVVLEGAAHRVFDGSTPWPLRRS